MRKTFLIRHYTTWTRQLLTEQERYPMSNYFVFLAGVGKNLAVYLPLLLLFLFGIYSPSHAADFATRCQNPTVL